MTKNSKTPEGAGACKCVEPCLNCQCQATTKVPAIQAPLMGTALRAFLRRYVANIRTYDEHHGDKITKQMIDCGEFLLIEGERLEGGGV